MPSDTIHIEDDCSYRCTDTNQQRSPLFKQV